MPRYPLLRAVDIAAKAARITPTLVRSSLTPDDWGDGEAIFQLGSLLLRFTQDRGQHFVDVAPAVRPDRFHFFDDIEIAFGWKSIEEVLAKREPDALAQVLARIGAQMHELDRAFAPEQIDTTLQQVETAAMRRGEAFVARLG